MINLLNGNCLDLMRSMPDNSVDSIVTDPPYGLNFMGKKWDCSVPSVEIWAECLRVLKPGGHLLAFAGTRTQHRMAVNIEDAGFEIRDMIAWVYGSGFPTSMDVSKAIDKVDAAHARRARQLRFTEWMRGTGLTSARINEITDTNMGSHYTTAASQPSIATREHFENLRPHFGVDVPDWVEQMVDERTVESENFKRREVVGRSANGIAGGSGKHAGEGSAYGFGAEFDITAPATDAAHQWQGWGTALKPALEPITIARKPFKGTVAANVLEWGTGAINIDGCRVGEFHNVTPSGVDRRNAALAEAGYRPSTYQMGEKAPNTPPGRWPANLIHDGSDEILKNFPSSVSPWIGNANKGAKGGVMFGGSQQSISDKTEYRDAGSAARFFYCAKASRKDRGASNNHPTVKPTDLMRYLCRLVTPPKGIVLDPFMGSGSTGKAAVLEGFSFVGMELDADYFKIAQARVSSSNQSDSGQCGLFDGVIAP